MIQDNVLLLFRLVSSTGESTTLVECFGILWKCSFPPKNVCNISELEVTEAKVELDHHSQVQVTLQV